MLKINSAECGAGKTTSIITEAKKARLLGASALIVQPSIHLLEETAAKIKDCVVIHSGRCHNVSKEIHRAMSLSNQIVLITTQAYLQNDLDTNNRYVFIDEEIDPYTPIKINLCHTSEKLCLSDYYIVTDCEYDGYKELQATTHLKDIMLNGNQDDVLYVFQTLNEAVVSDCNNVYITDDMGDKLVDNDGLFYAHILLNKNKFKGNLAFYGARIEHSLLFKVIDFSNIKITRQFKKHDGRKVTIHSAYNMGWSKNANKNHADIKDTFMDYVRDNTDNDYLVLDNRDQHHSEIKDIRCLTHNPHGINKYRDYTNVVVMSAINPTPTSKRFLNEVVGIRDSQIKDHYMSNLYYQTAMRTALRNKGNKQEVNIFCLDGYVGFVLEMDYFNNAKTKNIDNTSFPVKEQALTAAEHNKGNMIRKNFPQISDMPTRDIMKLGIWEAASARGLIKKEVADLVKTDDHLNRLLGVVEKTNSIVKSTTPNGSVEKTNSIVKSHEPMTTDKDVINIDRHKNTNVYEILAKLNKEKENANRE